MKNLIMLNENAALYHQNLMQKRKPTKKEWALEIESICEEYHGFRDYEILDIALYGTLSKVGIHKRIDDFKDLEYEINDSINAFCQHGFSIIYFYV